MVTVKKKSVKMVMFWELTTPIFMGTFMAMSLMLILMGKIHKLFRGPRMFFAWAFAEPGFYGDRKKCRCGSGKCKCWPGKCTCRPGMCKWKKRVMSKRVMTPEPEPKKVMVEKGRDSWVCS